MAARCADPGSSCYPVGAYAVERGDLDGLCLNPGIAWGDAAMASFALQQALGLRDLRYSVMMNLGGATAAAMVQNAVLAIDAAWRAQLQDVEALRAKQKAANNAMAALPKGSPEFLAKVGEMKAVAAQVKEREAQLKETEEENQKTNEEVMRDRQYMIDAAIVRIMKARKTLSHKLLIAELLQHIRLRTHTLAQPLHLLAVALVERRQAEVDEDRRRGHGRRRRGGRSGCQGCGRDGRDGRSGHAGRIGLSGCLGAPGRCRRKRHRRVPEARHDRRHAGRGAPLRRRRGSARARRARSCAGSAR